ncbi:MAG TPA: FmdE family protein [Spirochaetia bacterium]|nr:FmdE family protein [Spirochaetia bacterium]
MRSLKELLERSCRGHSKLCPRQVLGVRMAMAAVAALGLEVPRSDKRLLVIAETDGCFVDGVEAVTGCTVGHRTLRIEDYGKVAATFVDTSSGAAVRVAPRSGVRHRALSYAPGEAGHYQGQLAGYQVMPEEELLALQRVQLAVSVEAIRGRANVRTLCDSCQEEIINDRQVTRDGRTLCRACASTPYYVPAAGEIPLL